MTTTLPEHAGRNCYNAVNPLHATLYFSPDMATELAPYGVEDPRAVYLAGRGAVLGAVSAGTLAATFYNFSHAMIAQLVPALWESVTPEAVLAARLRAMDTTLRRLLGDDAVESKEIQEAAGLALRATEGCTRAGRPLYAGNADLPVPDAPHLALWHAATLLREHRGDAHVALLQHHELDPLEALVSDSAKGGAMGVRRILASRGYTEEDWTAAQGRLRERGLLDTEGELTERGHSLRVELEESTDRLDRRPYELLGAADVARLTGLAAGFTRTAARNGAFPAELLGKG